MILQTKNDLDGLAEFPLHGREGTKIRSNCLKRIGVFVTHGLLVLLGLTAWSGGRMVQPDRGPEFEQGSVPRSGGVPVTGCPLPAGTVLSGHGSNPPSCDVGHRPSISTGRWAVGSMRPSPDRVCPSDRRVGMQRPPELERPC